MDGGSIATVVCTAISVIGTIAVAIITNRTKGQVQKGTEATQSVQEKIASMEDSISEIKQELAENNLETLATDITVALEHHEDDIEPLIALGRKYFVKLGGNSHISKPYAAWAIKHNIDISEFYTEHNNLKLYMENPELITKGV